MKQKHCFIWNRKGASLRKKKKSYSISGNTDRHIEEYDVTYKWLL